MSDSTIVLYRPRRRGNGWLVAARYPIDEDFLTIDIYVPDALVDRTKRFIQVAGHEVGYDIEVGAFWDSATSILKQIASNPLAKMAAGVIPGGATVLDGASLAFSAADHLRPKKKAPAKPDVASVLLKRYGEQLARHERELKEMRKALDDLRAGRAPSNPQLAPAAKEYEKRRLTAAAHVLAQNDPQQRAKLDEMAEHDDTIAGVVAALDALTDDGIYVSGDDDFDVDDDDANVAAERLRRMLAGDDISA